MIDAVHLEAVERILASISNQGEFMLSEFAFGRPGSPPRDKRFVGQVFADRRAFTEALLFIREKGAPYLRAISVSDIWSMVTNFITENFWHIGGDTFLSKIDGAFANHVTRENKLALAAALSSSGLFHPATELTLYPLVPILVSEGFEDEQFVLLAPEQLRTSHLDAFGIGRGFDPTSFPPFPDWQGVRKQPAAWLGVRSPLPMVSDKLAAAILGSVALTPLPRYRYMFSGRKMFGGKCTANAITFSVGREFGHTPPLMENVTITRDDHGWLGKLAAVLKADDLTSRRKVRALEYFYRGWFLGPRERFPTLCMSLDSLVGVSNSHTAEAIKFVRRTVGADIDVERLRLLMRVRGAVIHGAAPDVYDSENYARYYAEYGTDPIRDLELIVAKCLRVDIFGGELRYHLDPHAAILAEEQRKGRLPRVFQPAAIISEDD